MAGLEDNLQAIWRQIGEQQRRIERLAALEVGPLSGLSLFDPDVAHGVTTVAATNIYGLLSAISGTVGGLRIDGLADADGVALVLRGIQSSDPTDTTPAVRIIGAKANGTGVQDLGAAETVFAVANNDDADALRVLGNKDVVLAGALIGPATASLYNTVTTTLNIGGAATAIALGAASTVVTLGANGTINGGSAANDDLTLQGTSHATRTTSYVLLQPNGGNVGIGTTGPISLLDVSNTTTHTYINPRAASGSFALGTDIFSWNHALNIGGDIQNGGTGGGVSMLAYNSGTASWNRIIYYRNAASNPDLILQQDGGRVAIGLTTPSEILHIQGAGSADASLHFQQIIASTGAYNSTPMAGINFYNKYNAAGAYAGMGGISVVKENTTDGNLASYLALHTRPAGGSVTQRMKIASDGTFTGSASNDISDVRLKENVSTVESALARITQLRGVRFNWTQESNMTDRPQFGVIAQEVEPVFPELVLNTSVFGDGYKSVQYGGFVAPFIEAIKELHQTIQQQAARIAELERRIA